MTQKQRQYSKQFKVDAVKLVTEQGYKVSEAARNLGIHPSPLRGWQRQLETDGKQASKELIELSDLSPEQKDRVLVICRTGYETFQSLKVHRQKAPGNYFDFANSCRNVNGDARVPHAIRERWKGDAGKTLAHLPYCNTGSISNRSSAYTVSNP